MILTAVILKSFLISAPLTFEVRLQNKPLAKQKVEVFGFKAGQEKYSKTLETDASGRVRFDVPTTEDINLIARTVYQDLQYFSPMIFSENLPKQNILIRVFPTAVSSDKISVSDFRIFLSREGESLRLDYEILIDNPTDTTIVGEKTGPESEVLRLSLPANGFDLQLSGGFENQDTRFEGNDIISTRPLTPGINRYSLSYSLENPGMSLSFVQNLNFPVKEISVASSIEGLSIRSPGMEKKGTKFFDGISVPVFTERRKNPEKNIGLDIRGLPLMYRFSQLMGPLSFLILILAAVIFSRKKDAQLVSHQKTRLLKDLSVLQGLKKKGLIDPFEFDREKIVILENLYPFYASSSKEEASVRKKS